MNFVTRILLTSDLRPPARANICRMGVLYNESPGAGAGTHQ